MRVWRPAITDGRPYSRLEGPAMRRMATSRCSITTNRTTSETFWIISISSGVPTP